MFGVQSGASIVTFESASGETRVIAVVVILVGSVEAGMLLILFLDLN